uniref:hypothetical protein n=1 Tax=Lachnospira sp. TaxID=2049031 RepID=UPI0040285436
YVPIKEIFEHYNLSNKLTCYFSFKNAILNTVQNKYSVYNYRQLSDFDNKAIEKNIAQLHNNLSVNIHNISATEQAVNNILKNGTFDELINYVNTLTDDIILNDIPDIPKFIVKYINSTPEIQDEIAMCVSEYKDIAKFL